MAPIPNPKVKGVKISLNDSPLEDPNKFHLHPDAIKIFETRVEFSINFHKDDWETYEIFKYLGFGGAGAVYEARRMKTSVENGSSQRTLAIKFLQLEGEAGVPKEIKLLQQLPAPCYDMKNIVRYRAYIPCTNVFKTAKKWGVVFMDVARNGCLIDWLQRPHRSEKRFHFPEKVARRIVLELISSLSSLRQNGVSHRDIKADNTFIDSQGRFLLGDFGHVRVVKGSNKKDANFMKISTPTNERVGTRGDNPPELLRGETEYDSEKVDVFQLGYLLLTMLTAQDVFQIGSKQGGQPGKVLTREMLDHENLDPRRKDVFWQKWDYVISHEKFRDKPKISKPCRKLLSAMLSFDPKLRPTFAELLAAVNSNISDTKNNLRWLSSANASCSLKELYNELHERIAANTNEEINAFVQTQATWSTLRRLVLPASVFRANGRRARTTDDSVGDGAPTRMTRRRTITDANDRGVDGDGSSSSSSSSSGSSNGGVIATDDTDEERNFFASSTSEHWGDASLRPSMSWVIRLRNNTKEGAYSMLNVLMQKLCKEFEDLNISKDTSGLYDCWSMSCTSENQSYSFNATLHQKEVSNDNMELNSCDDDDDDSGGDGDHFVLNVRRNYGNAMHIQSMFNDSFDSHELSQLWRDTCPVYQPVSTSQGTSSNSGECKSISDSSTSSNSVVEVAQRGWSFIRTQVRIFFNRM